MPKGEREQTMASAELEPITGLWGRSPRRGPGADLPWWGQRGEARPFKLNAFCPFSYNRGDKK